MNSHIAAWLMLSAGGLFAGGILMFAVERTNLWRRMPLDQYVIDFRRSLFRADPLMPILGILSAIGAVLFAVDSQGRAASMAWSGTGLIAAVIIGSILIGEPINSKFRRLPEGQAPENSERLRIVWRRFHFARTITALAAFGCLAAASA